jgi:hypothetical protein
MMRFPTIDEQTLARLVAARLDLPMTQNVLNQNIERSIIKRCWEEQLRFQGKFLVGSLI